jgi:hypothetical protein
VTPIERCLAVGTICTGEIMYPGVHGAAPSARLVGACDVPLGAAVINTSDDGRYLPVAAVGYPRGVYRGGLSYFGETPDPAHACRQAGQPVTYPLGATVTLFAPTGASFAVVDSVTGPDGVPLRGCRLANQFIPDDALAADTTYAASGRWGATPSGLLRVHAWTFRTGPAPAAPVSPVLPLGGPIHRRRARRRSAPRRAGAA